MCGDEEHILHTFAQGLYLCRLNGHTMLHEDLADIGQQAGTIRCGHLQHSPATVFILADGGLGRYDKGFLPSGGPAGHSSYLVAHQGPGQHLADTVQGVGITGKRVAIRLQDVKSVQSCAVTAQVNPGVIDTEVQELQLRADPGKQIGLIRCVDEDLGCVGYGRVTALPHQHQGGIEVAVIGNGFGVPGDVIGPFPDEVVVAPARPNGLYILFGETPVFQEFRRGSTG